MVEAPNKLLDRARAELHTFDRVGKQTASELILALFEAERQIAELRTKLDEYKEVAHDRTAAWTAAEAENARLRVLPLKDEVERVLEPFAALGEWEHLPGTDMPDEFEPCLTRHYKTVPITIGHLRAARALLERLRAGEQEGWRSQAADDVLAERRRQVEAEGWTPEHDNVHSDGQMAAAAACYAKTASMPGIDRAAAHFGTPIGWPWGREWWKPKDRRRDLVRAAALLIAEIERLDRRTAAPSEQGGDRG